MAMVLLDATGDLDTSTGRIVVTTDPAVQYRQKMNARLNAWQGEWYQDLNKGVPWYQRVLIKNPRLADIQALLRQVIMSVSGTSSVTFTLFDLDTRTRKLRVSFRTTTNFTDQPLNFDWALDLTRNR